MVLCPATGLAYPLFQVQQAVTGFRIFVSEGRPFRLRNRDNRLGISDVEKSSPGRPDVVQNTVQDLKLEDAAINVIGDPRTLTLDHNRSRPHRPPISVSQDREKERPTPIDFLEVKRQSLAKRQVLLGAKTSVGNFQHIPTAS